MTYEPYLIYLPAFAFNVFSRPIISPWALLLSCYFWCVLNDYWYTWDWAASFDRAYQSCCVARFGRVTLCTCWHLWNLYTFGNKCWDRWTYRLRPNYPLEMIKPLVCYSFYLDKLTPWILTISPHFKVGASSLIISLLIIKLNYNFILTIAHHV